MMESANYLYLYHLWGWKTGKGRIIRYHSRKGAYKAHIESRKVSLVAATVSEPEEAQGLEPRPLRKQCQRMLGL